MDKLLLGFGIMGKCMLGIFTVMIIIIISVYLLNFFTNKK